MDFPNRHIGPEEALDSQEKFRMWLVQEVTTLRLQVSDLVGNGKPGRVAVLETKQEKLENDVSRSKHIFYGISLAISFFVSVGAIIAKKWGGFFLP